MKLPFTKGIWLAVLTGLLIVCLAPGAFLATLGCAASPEDRWTEDDPIPGVLSVYARLYFTVLTPAGVPAANQTIYIKPIVGQLHCAPRIEEATVTRTTEADGTAVWGDHWTVRKDENVYVWFGFGTDSGQMHTFTWEFMVLIAEGGSGGNWVSTPAKYVRLTVPGSALE